jgi:DNA-binding NtrC family response regulator
MPTPKIERIPGRVLVIDDDRSARMLLERVLGRAGHTVVSADSAELGLAKLDEHTFDLLITDKNLPGVDGFEVLKRAKEKNPGLQVVLITGFPTPETKAHARDLGVFSYVTKPFGVYDMLDICDAAIRAGSGVKG